MKKILLSLLAGSVPLTCLAARAPASQITVDIPAAARAQGPMDGRLMVLFSTKTTPEPRLQIEDNDLLAAPYLFGRNVRQWGPGAHTVLDGPTYGWPARRLSDLRPGDYTVQAVLNRYETFHRSDGSTVSLPPDQGEGQHWELKPGNLYSRPQTVHVGPNGQVSAHLALTETIAPITPPVDTPFVKHVRIQSALLSKFWGRPVYLGANILLPAGFEQHPNAHYPVMVFHGHFPSDISEFRTTPPDPNLKPEYSSRFHLAGYNIIEQQQAYAFYQKWISPDFPRFIVVEVQHANPYYDDSYAVNSANLGPYGDAINHELIPEIEKRFRGLAEGWSRFTYGGSTGGWEALATQVFYPDMYNGAFAACPDPVAFNAFTVIDLYKDANAYVLQGQALTVDRPAMRNYLGEIAFSQRDGNHFELADGDHGRSGGQFDIWQAVYSPRGADGYPAPIYDKESGVIDHKVAAYWRDHYDLNNIIKRDWATLGPKLAGKIHVYVGAADSYYLNNAVYTLQDTLQSLKEPAYGGEVAYGERAEHCWNGDPTRPNAYSRLRYNVMYLPKILARIKASAPQGADVTSWRY